MDTKSEQTFKAGDKLLSSSFYTQCAHCFYYSVIQKMKFCLAKCNSNPIDYENQESKSKESEGSSHIWVFNEIKHRISNRRSKDAFDNEFEFLKKERVAADYTTRAFTQLQGATCKETAEKLLARLRDLV